EDAKTRKYENAKSGRDGRGWARFQKSSNYFLRAFALSRFRVKMPDFALSPFRAFAFSAEPYASRSAIPSSRRLTIARGASAGREQAFGQSLDKPQTELRKTQVTNSLLCSRSSPRSTPWRSTPWI